MPHNLFGTWYVSAWRVQPAFISRESYAYDNLAEEQGRLLPHCYGFHSFEFPSGEKSIALVTELVQGKDLPFFINDSLSEAAQTVDGKVNGADRTFLFQILDRVGAAYEYMYSKGVIHGDASTGNIKVVPTIDDYQLVFLDFGLASGELIRPKHRRPSWKMTETYQNLFESLRGIIDNDVLSEYTKTPNFQNLNSGIFGS